MSPSLMRVQHWQLSATAGGNAFRCQPYNLLFLLGADPADVLDGQGRAAGFFGDLAVLLEDVASGRLVAIEAAEQFRRHAPVGALRIVLIDNVEKGEFAFGIATGLFCHGGLSWIWRLKSKKKTGFPCSIWRAGACG